MAVELRTGFHRQLADMEAALVRLFAMVSDGVAASTDALLAGDRRVAGMLDAREVEANGLSAKVEELATTALACQAPVGSDLRLVVSALRLGPELERCHDLVVHVAERGVSGVGLQLSPQSRGRIGLMGELTAQMWLTVGRAFERRDLTELPLLPVRDRELDALRDGLVEQLVADAASFPMAMEGVLIGRFFERLGDHAVSTSRRVRYVVSACDN